MPLVEDELARRGADDAVRGARLTGEKDVAVDDDAPLAVAAGRRDYDRGPGVVAKGLRGVDRPLKRLAVIGREVTDGTEVHGVQNERLERDDDSRIVERDGTLGRHREAPVLVLHPLRDGHRTPGDDRLAAPDHRAAGVGPVRAVLFARSLILHEDDVGAGSAIALDRHAERDVGGAHGSARRRGDRHLPLARVRGNDRDKIVGRRTRSGDDRSKKRFPEG